MAVEYSAAGLRKKILGSSLNRSVFSTGRGVYLVGGYLRDIFVSSAHSRDLDYVVSEGLEEIVSRLSVALNATVVELGKERITRLVLRDTRTLDFSMINEDVELDLKSRDFTVNAMAWSPETGLLDPHGGLADIKKGVIRGILRRNFEDDPLRLLRAYRFSAEKSWRIAPATERIIRELSRKIARPATERITLEFFRILNSAEPSRALGAALKDGLLEGIISLSCKGLQENLKLVSSIRTKLEKLPETHYLKFSSQGLCYRGLLRLESLLLGSAFGKNRLSLSREAAKRSSTVNEYYERFMMLKNMNKGEVFDLFFEAGEAAPDLLILTGHESRLPEYESFMRISRRGLLKAEEIMKARGIAQGPELGALIYKVKRLQFEGVLKRKRAAASWLKKAGIESVKTEASG